ncbi:kinase-like domain-containing protein [Rhizophagus clarus]|uniref:Kinase-like domain-containing protein n=1 Tax=Rhizophagus clarus TaxID=94130 RepID=A0A8H3L0X1_9GLOM|nr:kinase-like domain-containing protein [Rhizophagus clarus]
MVLKCSNNLNENLKEFLNEWDYHEKCLVVKDIIGAWIFRYYESNNETSDNETSNNETSDNESSEEFSDYKIKSECLDDCIVDNIKSYEIGTNKN